MRLDDVIAASEEQSELLEKLRDLIKKSEDRVLTEEEIESINQILTRLSELRMSITSLTDMEGEDADLLKEFYALVGGEEEKMIFQDLLEAVKKGKINIPKEVIEDHIREIEKFIRLFR